LEAAAEAMAIASAINAFTRRTTTTFDTMVVFKPVGARSC
jgi:1,2-phenylacetyl-CoA epoxidase PaaB subunit